MPLAVPYGRPLTDDFQPLPILLSHAAQVRRDRTFIAIDLLVASFVTADHHLLIRRSCGSACLRLSALDEHVAAAIHLY